MLAPDSRAVLLDQLRPPLGFWLDAAVATTFTLDLGAALGPPLAFAPFAMLGTRDPVAAMEAVRACADRIDVFCQAGQIKIPTQPTDIMAFVDKMVHEVKRPKKPFLFHPKLWFLRYVDSEEEVRHRFICLSRNLAHDQSWDAVLTLDGTPGGRHDARNRPLAELIRSLPDRTVKRISDKRRARIDSLAEDARGMSWQAPDGVDEVRFHVYGVPGVPRSHDFGGSKHLVVAPFLNTAGLDVVAPGRSEVTVVSRTEDLDALPAEAAGRLKPFVLSDMAGIEPGGVDTAPLDELDIHFGLHAKIYVAERARRGHVFVGSANATGAAFHGNVEILVELVGGRTKLGVDAFLGEDAPFSRLVEPYVPGDTPIGDGKPWQALLDVVRDLASIPHTVTVLPGPRLHDVKVTTEAPLPIPDGYTATAELLTRAGEARTLKRQQPVSEHFQAVRTEDVTSFVVLRVRSLAGLEYGTVVRADLVNDPPGRLDEILARQVDTTEKFLRYLALLLGLAGPDDPGGPVASGSGGGTGAYGSLQPGVFEAVLRALADDRGTLEDLDRLVTRLSATEEGRAVLPVGFEELWRTVRIARTRLAEVTSDDAPSVRPAAGAGRSQGLPAGDGQPCDQPLLWA